MGVTGFHLPSSDLNFQEAILVGDSLHRDREGARRMGMRFIWIAPRDVQASGAQLSGRLPDHSVVARLGDLAKILL